jgi:hypothetical protein
MTIRNPLVEGKLTLALDKAFSEDISRWATSNFAGARSTDTLSTADMLAVIRNVWNMRVVYEPASLADESIAKIVGGIVGRIAYKKQWRAIVTRKSERRETIVDLRHAEPNADEWDRPELTVAEVTMPVQLADVLVLQDGEHYVKHRIIGAIIASEMHELDEWLRFDGKRVKDPHGDKP